MAPGRSSRRQEHSPQPVQSRSHHSQQFDGPEASLLTPAMPSRTNAELNLSVLRRHNPSVVHVLSIAPYAVIYIFSTSFQMWEKTGIEGTLFVCRLTSDRDTQDNEDDDDLQQEERYRVIVLNRRGLDNFELDLRKAEDIEITDEYVILQGTDAHAYETGIGRDGGGVDAPVIYGLWIFAEPPPSSTADMRIINAKVIQDCAWRAEASRKAIAEKRRKRAQLTKASEMGTSMTSALSAREFFGQQDGGNVAYSQQNTNEFNGSTEHYAGRQSGDVLGDLFRRARQEYSSYE